MSHELTVRADGAVEFAYLASDGTPWHGLGQALEDGTSIDAWREAAGMDWRIRRSQVRYAVDRDAEQFITLPEQHVLFRSDTNAPLGVVSNKYQVVQPGEVIEFFRDIAKAGGLELSAAGTIYGGKRFWATAKIGEAAPASVADKIGGYILISTSADGSLATEVRRTTVRTVCKNTLQMAMADAKASIKVSHRSVFDPASVKEFMGLNTAAWDSFRHTVTRLANIEMLEEEAIEMTAQVFGGGEKVRETAGYKKVLSLFNGAGMGATLDGVMGTRWGFLNAVTEYADHHVRARTDENRFVASQWGAGADLKARTLDLLTA
ncbi:LGT_TIGR03299, phage/plasmid-like protein TIGR03299 [uncultured Caudovirales phage]|uniref:LGT_TIGR03299, phage/plasmid-like protein TIGR03299 n=1 Tax=uncultured Caudovirales phage TaxID=2100421 RepID=A0A6J5LD69_9CAUD|nr:LGT_TIGR03299, phage/plasmid-like protein TIGR03299 [uncultured Caudovirales phage]